MRPIQSRERCDQFSIVLLSPFVPIQTPSLILTCQLMVVRGWMKKKVQEGRSLVRRFGDSGLLRAETTRYWPDTRKGLLAAAGRTTFHPSAQPPPPALYGNLNPLHKLREMSSLFHQIKKDWEREEEQVFIWQNLVKPKMQRSEIFGWTLLPRGVASCWVCWAARSCLKAAWTGRGKQSKLKQLPGKPALLPGGCTVQPPPYPCQRTTLCKGSKKGSLMNMWHNKLVGYFYNSFNDSLLLLLHRLAPDNPISMGGPLLPLARCAAVK